jgi:hypothetical protein
MARVRFIEDFDYRPTPRVVIAYKAGMELTVKRDCCTQASAKGKAIELPAPTEDNANVEG